VLCKIFEAKNEIKVIGTRHGEKKHETLLNREEIVRSEDMGDYYRVPSDTRDLNYDLYFVDGQSEISEGQDYTSGNTYQLTDDELQKMLLDLDYVKQELKKWREK
jgi:UDP-glucose 4-epimerase